MFDSVRRRRCIHHSTCSSTSHAAACRLLCRYIPACTHYASAYVFGGIARLIETRASAVASASAIAIPFAFAGASEAMSICAFAVPVSAASRLGRSLLNPAASFVTTTLAVVASSIVAYDATLASADSFAAALLVAIATANACVRQHATCAPDLSSLIRRVARTMRVCTEGASRRCTPEEPRHALLARECVTVLLNTAFIAAARCERRTTTRGSTHASVPSPIASFVPAASRTYEHIRHCPARTHVTTILMRTHISVRHHGNALGFICATCTAIWCAL
eukprot:2273339-Pleurochrysis_carterae.AAC.1